MSDSVKLINATPSKGEVSTTVTVNAAEHMENSSKSTTEYNVWRLLSLHVVLVRTYLRKLKTRVEYFSNLQDFKPSLEVQHK